MDNNELIKKIRANVIGENYPITTPFGCKPLVYADYTASGRSLKFIEDKIQSLVMPYYANTHTESSYTGAQSTALREEARQQIRQAVGGKEEDKVIFCGSGATAAINKLIDILNLRIPKDLDDKYGFSSTIEDVQRPVVFIGPYEHHSNELPWRETIATLVVIPLDDQGQLDINDLEKQLKIFQDRNLLIGSFSAASNVTGIKTDVDAVTRLLHKYKALSFWDYAASAPYVNITMSGNSVDTYKDAVFISPHKFIGGPGTPGLLIIKENIMTNQVPAIQGGGTVVYVTPEDHSYTEDRERREEGGTPAIIESIRAGLVFKLQQEVSTKEICAREDRFLKIANDRLGKNKNINVLGNIDAPQLSISSFIINHKGKALHYGFVVVLLNDLFGIQARGGCSCAGPYGHKLVTAHKVVAGAHY
jgi:selenocysteine lyase/cysteine desulfurase